MRIESDKKRAMNKMLINVRMFMLGALTVLLAGCSGDIVTTRAYFNPNWTPDGMIIAGKWTRTVETNTLLGGVSDQTIVKENKYEVVKFDVSGNNETVLFNAGNLGGDVYITMSPNGSYVTVGSELYTSSGTFVAEIVSQSVDSLDWSSDSSQIVVANDGTGNNVGTYTIASGGYSAIAEGGWVCWRVTDNIIFANTVGSGQSIDLIDSLGSDKSLSSLDLAYPQFLPSTNAFICVGLSNIGYTYSLPDYSLVSTFSFTEDRAWRWHVSPDGTKIIFGKVGTQPLRFSGVWVMDINGGNLARIE